MKLLLIPFLFLFLCSCSPSRIDTFTSGIVERQTKAYKDGSCYYRIDCIDKQCLYTNSDLYTDVEDSCNKFNIGDTVTLMMTGK